MSKESFKGFVKKNPNLISFVNNDEMTWQKFYDMYELYGEDSVVWEKYKSDKDANSKSSRKTGLLEDTSIKELFDYIKHVDLESVRKGVEGVQKAINLIQDLGGGDKKTTSNYQKRPMYKYFED